MSVFAAPTKEDTATYAQTNGMRVIQIAPKAIRAP